MWSILGMIISEKQIMQLMQIAREFQSILIMAPEGERCKKQYDQIGSILTTIANQQSEELKKIE
jgi:hypothetical protein